MPRFCITWITFCFLVLPVSPIFAQEQDSGTTAQPKSVEQLAKLVRPSVVVIKHTGRDGQERGLGTGFIISKDGLIATNLHVIGEARPITVQLASGKEYPVKVVHSSDRTLDLALLKIEAKNLPALPLGDSDKLTNGQEIVALGHPQGLRYSIVRGVVSGRPKVEGRKMIQLAIPIERGNSGGPVLDMNGHVQGIVTLKSQVTANLGFAMPINDLKRLVAKPNPIPMSRWVTIGRINPDQWQTVFHGNWRQRNGRIIVDGAGEGFGGRSLCLSKTMPPKVPIEIEVTVKLDDESGAGGLVFHSNGNTKHYGFYPSNGKLRLSRFEGPDVFSWTVLFQVKTVHYHPGDWNTLKVRIEKDRILGYVNGHKVVESDDHGLTKGKVGLVKFRTTHVEFKNFRIGAKLTALQPSPELTAKVEKLVEKISPKGNLDDKLVKTLAPEAPASMKALRQQAELLEKKAAKVRELARAVYKEKVLDELKKVLKAGDDLDLLRAALLIAKLDNEELDITTYVQQVDRLASEIKKTLPKNASEKARLDALNRELFTERGFHGSRSDYYNRANSYLNRVLDDREGIPITLSLVYMELAHRLGLKMAGVGLPGHFIVQFQPKKGKPFLIDVFEGGKKMSRADVKRKVRALTGKPLQEKHLAPVSKKNILIRMLYNLTGIARNEQDLAGVIRYQDAVLTIDPNLIEDRLLRAAARYQNGNKSGAIADLDWLLDNSPPGLDRERVRQIRRVLSRLE